MKFIFLGTGTASVEKLYHTCFVVEKEGEYLLVDGGGGNGILNQLEKSDVDITKINHIFLSHIHLDHSIGLLWVIRKRKQHQKEPVPLKIYGCREVLDEFLGLMQILLKKESKSVGTNIILEAVQDGEKRNICGMEIEFIDTKASKNTMYGFIISEKGKKYVFVGDETLKPDLIEKISGCDLLMHDAIGTDGEFDDSFLKRTCHSTPKMAGELATRAKAKALLLFHTTDKNFETKSVRYSKEARETFAGKIYVPSDASVLEIN